MAGTDKKAQNERAARGRAATTVVLRTPMGAGVQGQNARAARGEAATTVPVAPRRFNAAVRQAQAPTSSFARAAAPLIEMAYNAPSTLASLVTQDGRVAVRAGMDLLTGKPYGGEKVPVQPVEQALAQGREAMAQPSPISSMDRQSQLIAAILGSGLTVNEAATVSGILPQPATKNAPSAKDTIAAQAAALAKLQFDDQLAQAQELKATDLDGAKAVTESAAKNYFSQLAGLAGFNPQQLVMAQQLDQGAE